MINEIAIPGNMSALNALEISCRLTDSSSITKIQIAIDSMLAAYTKYLVLVIGMGFLGSRQFCILVNTHRCS